MKIQVHLTLGKGAYSRGEDRVDLVQRRFVGGASIFPPLVPDADGGLLAEVLHLFFIQRLEGHGRRPVEALPEGSGVYVHCKAGYSRSVAAVGTISEVGKDGRCGWGHGDDPESGAGSGGSKHKDIFDMGVCFQV